MKSWIRIAVVAFVLVGGTASFGYWSINQIDGAFDSFSASYLASISPLYSSTSSEPVFTLPQEDTGVYIGCTYPLSWRSSAKINSLEATLVSVDTNEAVGPKTGGLAKENIITEGSQSLNWKVGFVWPGTYFIQISKINGIDTEVKTKAFSINKMRDNVGVYERSVICEESGGLS